MAIFPMLQFQPGLAVPLPIRSLEWISLYFADDDTTRIGRLGELLLDQPWLLTLLVASRDEYRSGPPSDIGSLTIALDQYLSKRLGHDLIVAEVADDALDRWQLAARRIQSLANQAESFNRSGENATLRGDASASSSVQHGSKSRSFDRALRGACFSEGAVWLVKLNADASSASSDGAGECAPDWLRAWAERLEANQLDEDPMVASMQRLRQRLLAAESIEPWRPDRNAYFSPPATGQAAGFLACVARLADVHRRRCALEFEFAETVEEEKLQALKELAYGASHEVNNPLANIATRAQTLLRDESDPDRRRSLATINAQAFRAHEMVSDMMLFARPPKLERTTVELSKLGQEVLDKLADEAAAQETQLILEADREIQWEVDRTHLSVALRALCLNALEALRAGGAIRIRIHSEADSPEPQWVCLEVSDDGPGIPPEMRPRIFEPYFSGREAGRGLGLGLCKAWSIVRQHGGRLEVHGASPQGTTMHILLPTPTSSDVGLPARVVHASPPLPPRPKAKPTESNAGDEQSSKSSKSSKTSVTSETSETQKRQSELTG